MEHEGTYPLPEAQLDRFLMKLKIDYPHAEDELAIVRLNQAGLNGSVAGNGFRAPLSGASLSNDEAALGIEAVAALRAAAARVHIDEQIERYIVSIVAATRPPARTSVRGAGVASGSRKPSHTGAEAAFKAQTEGIYRYISFGASPRASIALYHCSKIAALFAGNTFVRPEDVKAMATPVLRHRLSLSYEAEADGLDADAVIVRILASVPAP
jgi:MoxR-like ATPase